MSESMSRLAEILGDVPHQACAEGLFCPREGVTPEQLVRLESALLQSGSLLVLDFQLGRPEDLTENAVPAPGSDPAAYRGVRRGDHRVFRVDHHHPLPELAETSTTPMVLRWLRGLWAAGEQVLLSEVARARYLADHCDPDILLSQHLAGSAEDREYLHGPMGAWLSAAAIRNDYIRLAPPELQPQADRIFYASLGIEEAIEEGAISFEEALLRWLPSLHPWLQGRAGAEEATRLDHWEGSRRSHEEATLARIRAWREEGRWQSLAGGRLVFLDAPEKIDNAELFLYVARESEGGSPPAVQVLRFPSNGGATSTFKLRSHAGYDLGPLYPLLNARFPGARFGGRAAAGGSRPTDGVAAADLLETLVQALM